MAILSSMTDIKPGVVLLYNGEPYLVQWSNFMRMQQRKPVMQTKMKHLVTGKVIEYSFKPGETIESADLERIRVNFLYHDHEGSHFMENENYEQFSFSDELLGTKAKFLKEGMEVQILKFNGNAINVDLPPKVEFKVTSAPPGVRGDSAQGSVMKECILENGLMVRTPLFVKEGDVVKVSTETGEYVERVEQKR